MLLSNLEKNINECLNINSPSSQNKTSKLIQRINFRQSLNKARIKNIINNSSITKDNIRRNSNVELQNLRLHLSENENLNKLENLKKLIYLIAQLNGVIPVNDEDDYYNEDEDVTSVITNKILKLFETYNSFYFFFSHYNIPKETIIKIIQKMQYQYFKKDEKIFKEGNICTKFYFLLKGKLSFIKRLMDGTQVEVFSKEEEGFHFGEWEIINNRFNKYTVICKEECYLIFLQKEIFVKYIQDKYTKIETNKKNFVINNLKNYLVIPPVKLERFIESNIKSLFFRKNDILFKKGEETKYLYLIYKGEVNIVKDIKEGEDTSFISERNNISIESIQKQAKKINYKKMIKKYIKKDEDSKIDLKLDISLNKNKYNIMTTLAKGSFIGLEIVTGVYFFKYTYVCKSDIVAVLEINIENLDEHLKELMINLMPYFFKLDEKIRQHIDKINILNYNLLPKTIKKYTTRNKFFRYNKYIDSLKIEENEKSVIKQLKKIRKKFDINEAGFIKMNKNNIILQDQKNILIEKLRDNYFKSKSLDLFLNDINKGKITSLKYKNVKMINNSMDKSKYDTNKINRSNSALFRQTKLNYFLIPEIRRVSNIQESKKKQNDNNIIKKIHIRKFFSKFNYKTLNFNDSLSKNYQNYNLYDKEQKSDMEKKIKIMKNNSIQYKNFIKHQRNKNNIKAIKQGLSLDCKELIKKVHIKNRFHNDNTKICFSVHNKNKSMDGKNKFESKNFKTNKSTINLFRKNVSDKFGSYNKKNIVKNIFLKKDKKLDFYNTGIFDMPLATQLGIKSQKKS